jgi:hypothetical protein
MPQEPRSKSPAWFCYRCEACLVELTFPDAMHKFDAGDCSRSIPKFLEAEHRSEPKFDGSMVLLDEIVIWHV